MRRLNWFRVIPVVLIALVFYCGMGIVTHLIFLSGEPDLSSVMTWGVIIAWPGALVLMALLVLFAIGVVIVALEILKELLDTLSRKRP